MSVLHRRMLVILLIVFLLVDILTSAYHYYHLSIDGDLTKIGTPILWYELIMQDPFGIHAVTTGELYSGAGRYFCHWATVFWCKYVFDAIHAVVKNPVVSIYLMTTSIAMLVHVLFLWIVALYVKVIKPINTFFTLILLCFATAFIQYGRFYHSIGIIDRSSSYIFFYALPLMIFALYFYPFFKAFHHRNYIFPSWLHLMLILTAVYLAFSSVLIQPVYFIFVMLMCGFYILSKKESPLRHFLKQKTIWPHLLFFLLLCIYAFYVSKFNNEKTNVTSLYERYILLLKGIYYLFTYNLALPIMLVLGSINLYIIKRFFDPKTTSLLFKQAYIILLFAILYVGMLPLGGYRAYRPFIVRYDTFMPVTLALVYYLSLTSIYILTSLKSIRFTTFYIVVFILFIAVFTIADKNLERDNNACQHEVLYYLYNHKDTLIPMPRHCNVGTWNTTDYDDEQVMITLNKIYKQWGIIKPYQTIITLPINVEKEY